MIDKNFIKYSSYTDFYKDKANIPATSFVFIENPRMAYIRGKEYRFVGMKTVTEIQNFSPSSLDDVKNNSGAFIISNNETQKANGFLFQFSDTFNHTFEQIVLSNMIVSGGVLNGSHADGAMNICYRTFSFGGSLPSGKWTDWKCLEFNRVVSFFEKMGKECDLSGGNLYMQVSDDLAGNDELWFYPSSLSGTGQANFDIYIAEVFLKNTFDGMKDKDFKKITVNVYTGKTDSRKAGYYISKSGGGVYSLTAQADGSFKVRSTYAACDVITDASVDDNARIPMSCMFKFEINFFKVSSSKKYVTVMSYPTAIRSRQ